MLAAFGTLNVKADPTFNETTIVDAWDDFSLGPNGTTTLNETEFEVTTAAPSPAPLESYLEHVVILQL